MQIYIARLQKFSDALTDENKNVFSFAAKVQTVAYSSTFAVQAADCSIHVGQPLQSCWRRWQYESVERTGSGVGGRQRTSTSHGRHQDAVVGEVGRCQAMEALEDNQRQLEPHTLGRNVTSAGWQVTLCDPIWHVSSRSGVATVRTAIHLLLTYLITLCHGQPMEFVQHWRDVVELS